MPGSLNYSPSGSEGGRSIGGQADLDGSLVGVDLTNTPGACASQSRGPIVRTRQQDTVNNHIPMIDRTS